MRMLYGSTINIYLKKMNTTLTASDLLALIEHNCFSGAGLAEASMLEGEERRAYRLQQVERLLAEKHGYTPLAMYLSDMFWTADEGRKPIRADNPLTTQEGLLSLTDEQRRRLALTEEVAALCHDLSLHYAFDLEEALGIGGDFWVTNDELVVWLSATPYVHVAIHTAYIMKRIAIAQFEADNYMPAQDGLAELFSSEHHELVDRPDNTHMPPRDYVKAILDELLSIERHWQEGRRRQLKPDLVKLHDEIYGVVPLQFDDGVLQAAEALYDYMDTELQGRLVMDDYDPEVSWSKQPESVRRTTAEVLGRFADKVREVRAKYLAKGWVDDDSLAFNYLMAHAQRCGHGWWREEDEAL